MNENLIRYTVRSKDRLNPTIGNPANPVTGTTSNSPVNFQALFNPGVDARVSEFWVKLSNLSIGAIPYGVTKSLSAGAVRHALDTNA